MASLFGKMNQRTINALSLFLVWFVFFHSTSCNAFVLGVQAFRSPKMPSKTILTPNERPAHFKQLPVPNDNSALHILQIRIPTTTISTGLQAYNDHHSSLNDGTASQAFSAMTATTTVTMTQVSTITTAITKATLLKLDKCFLHPAKTSANNAMIKSESLLLHARFGSAILTARIHVQKLLLLSAQDDSAIMMATHTSYSLQLIVESFSKEAQQVAPANICNNYFKLIDALLSKGALFAPCILKTLSLTQTN
jgi:hypothetical protein